MGALQAQTAVAQAGALIQIARSPPDELAALLEKVDDWRFDSFALNDVTLVGGGGGGFDAWVC